MAVRRRRISVRTRVRLARFTSARSRDCAARFKTDFFFFLTLVACPCAIYCSLCVSLKLLTLNEADGFVKPVYSSSRLVTLCPFRFAFPLEQELLWSKVSQGLVRAHTVVSIFPVSQLVV